MDKYKYAKVLFPLWIVTCIWGLINLFSASYMFLISNDWSPFRYVLIQGIVVVICAIIMVVVVLAMREKGYVLMKNTSKMFFFFTLASLALLFVLGEDRGGAKSVFAIGPVDYQPMELYKITVIMYLAYVFHKCDSNQADLRELFKHLALPILGVVLILFQPDLGGAIICSAVILIAVLLNGRFIPFFLKFIGGCLALGIAGLTFILMLPEEVVAERYRLDRIFNWLDPFRDAQDASYQTVQALIGISNGGVGGVGYMNSIQKTFLDAGAATDYIFIVICEEWGIFGAALTLGLIFGLAVVCILIGLRATERYGQIFACTYGALLLVQTLVNVCGVTNLIPMTGVTLPFISNGMNSIFFLSMGILGCILIDVKTTYDKNKIKAQNYKKQQDLLHAKLNEDRRKRNEAGAQRF